MKKQRNKFIKMFFAIILLVVFCVTGLWHQHKKILYLDPNEYSIFSMIGTIVIFFLMIFIFYQSITLYKFSADMDSQTEIPNCDWVLRHGGMMYARKKLYDYTCIFLNIKDLKYINQKVGNQNGDKVIHDYAQKLYDFIKKRGFMGRLGGDNFLIFIKNEYVDDFFDYCSKIYVDVETDGEVERLNIHCRSGRCAIVPGVGYREFINRASVSLAEAKEKNLDSVSFEEDMINKIIIEKETLLECKNALKYGEFVPFYQPKVDAYSKVLCGAEALVRWKKNGEIILPYKFVPVLENEGSIVKLDYYMLECVCRDIKKWIEKGLEPVRVSVNFSKLHLKEPDFASNIFEIMQRYQVDSKYIEVELTESSCHEDFNALNKFSEIIRKKGIKLSVDDFGTGYSSLSMLRGFNADVIKLDKSFLDSASEGDPLSKKFIQDIIHMIDNQNEHILCEGVETEEQLVFLQEAGCHVIQGYYFDKPLPFEEFEKRLDSKQY